MNRIIRHVVIVALVLTGAVRLSAQHDRGMEIVPPGPGLAPFSIAA